MLIETNNLISITHAAQLLDSRYMCALRWASQGQLGRVIWISGHRFVLKAGVKAFLEKQREPKKRKT